jgi:hypothetical protein
VGAQPELLAPTDGQVQIAGVPRGDFTHGTAHSFMPLKCDAGAAAGRSPPAVDRALNTMASVL